MSRIKGVPVSGNLVIRMVPSRRKDGGINWKPAWVKPENANKPGYRIPTADEEKIVREAKGFVRDEGHRFKPQLIPSYQTEQHRIEAEEPIPPDDPKRIHTHLGVYDTTGQLKEHAVGEKHEDDEIAAEHRDEIINAGKKNYGEPLKRWQDKLNINFQPEKKVSIGGENFLADKYSHPNIGRIYVVDKNFSYQVVSPELKINKNFVNFREANNFARQIFEQRLYKSWLIGGISNFLTKAAIIEKIDELSKAVPKLNIMANYSAGENCVNLEGNGDDYVVKVNDFNTISTNSFPEAITKYYNEISKVINSNIDNRDLALDLFGDKVIQTNRRVIPMLADLGKSMEVEFLKNFDFSDLLHKVGPSPIFNIVPIQEEMGHGADMIGVKPSRGDLKPEDFQKNKKTEINQLPISEDETKAIEPVVITKSAFSPDAPKEIIGQDKPEPIIGDVQSDTIRSIPIIPEENKNAQEPDKIISNTVEIEETYCEQNPIIEKSQGIISFIERIAQKLNFSPNQINKDEFMSGMAEELEHEDVTGGNLFSTAKIVLSHLKEDPLYYSNLRNSSAKPQAVIAVIETQTKTPQFSNKEYIFEKMAKICKAVNEWFYSVQTDSSPSKILSGLKKAVDSDVYSGLAKIIAKNYDGQTGIPLYRTKKDIDIFINGLSRKTN